MKVPVTLKLAVLTLVTTAFYTYVGQLVPQKEVHPPQEVQITEEMTTDQLVELGQQIMEGKGLCYTCHTVGRSGALRFPDLQGIGARAGDRVAGMSALEYLGQSLYEPDAYVVEGFAPGMPRIADPPIDLTDQEIRAVIAKLQSMGGEATVTPTTEIPFASGH